VEPIDNQRNTSRAGNGRPARLAADVAVEQAAAQYGWARVEHRLHRNVFGRGDQRLVIGFTKTGRALDVALHFPLGFGTGFIDDPTPSFSTGGRDTEKLDTVLGWMAGPSTYPPLPSTLVVIPCAAKKMGVGAAARDLYVSDQFKLALRAAEARACAVGARVAIISAKHGLLALDQVLAPYDCTFGDPDAIAVDLLATHLSVQHVDTIEAMLPSRYLAVVQEALSIIERRGGERIELVNLYAGAAGIGYQRAVLSALLASDGHTTQRPTGEASRPLAHPSKTRACAPTGYAGIRY
jgi:hypothetical protein